MDSHYLESNEKIKLYVLVQVPYHYYDQAEPVTDQTVNAMAKWMHPLPELMKLAESIAKQ